MSRPPRLLKPGNRKLGADVWVWSLPSAETCPGRTPTCVANCYSLAWERLRPSNRVSYQRNLEASRQKDFARRLAYEIHEGGYKAVRWHGAGDLYSAAYARKLLWVVRDCPETVFWLYSRSWRVPAIARVLAEMAREPNCRVWYSVDRDTGLPEPPEGVRLAYLQVAADDRPAAADLVFRNGRTRKSPATRVSTELSGEARVCPVETGKPSAHKVTCSSCGICWRPHSESIRPGVRPLL